MKNIKISNGLNCKFNKIYVIESLPNDEKKTGEDLAEMLKTISDTYTDNSFEVEPFIEVESLEDWDKRFAKIANDCEISGIKPLLHFEIHGDENLRGLVLKNGELLSIEKFGETLRNINQLSGCNLIITLAVCHGLLSALANVSAIQEMPFVCALGSFETIYVKDLEIRFADFYGELLSSFDLKEAYNRLLASDSPFKGIYYWYTASDFFLKAYKNYITNKCDKKSICERAKECMPRNLDRNEKVKFCKAFEGKEKERRQKDYEHFRERFFLLNKFPENRDRFNVPKTWRELLAR